MSDDGSALREAMSELGQRWALGDAADFLEEVVGQGQSLQRRPRLELPVNLVGHVPELDHLWHVLTINCMCVTCQRVLRIAAGRRGRALAVT